MKFPLGECVNILRNTVKRKIGSTAHLTSEEYELTTLPIRSAVTNSTLSSLAGCATQRGGTYVCVVRGPLITVGTISESVKHTIHLAEVSRISLHFPNVPLLVFVTL